MPRGIELKIVCSPMDQINMVDHIEHQLSFIGKKSCMYKTRKECIKSKLHSFAGEIEHLGDVEAMLKTMIHYM